MTASIVSTHYLGTAMLSGMTQAQNAAHPAQSKSSSGQYADLGLQLGDQSGYELSLRNQTDLLQIADHRQQRSPSPISTTAQAALDSIRTTAQSAVDDADPSTAGSSSATPPCRALGPTRCRR